MNDDIYLNFSRSSFVLCRNASVIAEKVNWEAAWPHGMSHRFDSETCWRKVGSGEDSRAASASPCVFCAPKHRCSDGDWKFASTTQTGPPPRAARISPYERKWRHIPSQLPVRRTEPFVVNLLVLQERRTAPASFLPRERRLPSHRADTCLFPQSL